MGGVGVGGGSLGFGVEGVKRFGKEWVSGL